MSLLTISGCGTNEGLAKAIRATAGTSGLCSGLSQAVDTHAGEILDHASDTHEDVIISGTALIKGYDSECKND